MTDGPLLWGSLVEGAVRHYDPEEVKTGLPLEWVIERMGVELTPGVNNRLEGLCPFHADESPSFAVFGDDLDKCGCWTCDFTTGDVFDVLQRLHRVDFKEALQKAGELLTEFRGDSAWVSRAGQSIAKPKADPRELTAQAASAWTLVQADNTALRRLVDEKRRDNPGWEAVTPEFLHARWFVGAQDDWTVVVPHYAVDADSGLTQCRAIKTRTARSHLYAQTGSDLTELYGSWRDAGLPTVVICEGESDAWCADSKLAGEADVLAMPSGANTPPRAHWVERLKGRHVVIAMDGDSSGRNAARRWHKALLGRASSIRIAILPDGEDLASTHDLVRIIKEAVEVPPEVGNVQEYTGEDGRPVYTRWSGEDDVVKISNWALSPERELTFENGTKAYEGVVRGKACVLRAQDLESESTITKWSASVGGNWLGSKRDAQALLGVLESEGPFLARGMATGVAGWHDANFVWPGGRIGPDYWRYVPPLADVNLHVNLGMEPGDWDRRVFNVMFQMHETDVMHPILAWLAVAPLRSLFRTFPFLAVTGSSGSGKTTLVETILNAWGWKIHTTLTATTPHAVHSFAGATNGLPVWFDEYRPGARQDSLDAMNQVLRDAYDGTPSYKGGAQENKQALTSMPTTSPIIVTGEDAFSETSHIERMILVNLPARGRNPAALTALQRIDTAGLGYAYVHWLVGAFRRGELPSLHVDRSAGRIAANMQVLEIGWNLLRGFIQAATGGDLPAPDFSRVSRGIAEASATDPITDAMAWATHSTAFGGPPVMIDNDDVVVKLEEFVREVEKSGQFILPGKKTAIGKYLDEHWNARTENHPQHGRVKRLVGMGSLLWAAMAGQ